MPCHFKVPLLWWKLTREKRSCARDLWRACGRDGRTSLRAWPNARHRLGRRNFTKTHPQPNLHVADGTLGNCPSQPPSPHLSSCPTPTCPFPLPIPPGHAPFLYWECIWFPRKPCLFIVAKGKLTQLLFQTAMGTLNSESERRFSLRRSSSPEPLVRLFSYHFLSSQL